MKASLVVISLVALPLAAFAATKDEVLQTQRVKRTAINLFLTGAPGSAVTHLKFNIRPEPGSGGDAIALIQSLIEISGEFYNRRDLAMAREAAVQALAAAEPLLTGRLPAAASRRADLYSSLAVLHETVLFDLRGAQALYEAAGALNPNDRLIKQRKSAVIERQKARNGGGR